MFALTATLQSALQHWVTLLHHVRILHLHELAELLCCLGDDVVWGDAANSTQPPFLIVLSACRRVRHVSFIACKWRIVRRYTVHKKSRLVRHLVPTIATCATPCFVPLPIYILRAPSRLPTPATRPANRIEHGPENASSRLRAYSRTSASTARF